MCIKYNVPRLIYTSDASVTLTSYLGLAPFAVVVNLTESKTKQVTSDKDILVPGYSVTKYRAEKIVLGANGTNLANGTGMRTLARLAHFISAPFVTLPFVCYWDAIGSREISRLTLKATGFISKVHEPDTRRDANEKNEKETIFKKNSIFDRRWTAHNIHPTDCVVRRRRSILFPNVGQIHKENRRHHTKGAGRWWKTSNDLCRLVNLYNCPIFISLPHSLPFTTQFVMVYFCGFSCLNSKKREKKTAKILNYFPFFLLHEPKNKWNRERCLGTHSSKANVKKFIEKYRWFAGIRNGWHSHWRHITVLPALVSSHRCLQHSSNVVVIAIVAWLLAGHSIRIDHFNVESDFWHEAQLSTESIVRICWLATTIQPITGRIAHGLWTTLQRRAFTGRQC